MPLAVRDADPQFGSRRARCVPRLRRYERIVAVARTIDPRTSPIVLLGGEARLRCGEMIALEWSDVDLAKRQLCVRRSDWNGHVYAQTGRQRYLPHTRRLAAALAEHRHLRNERVLCQDDCTPFSRQIVQNRIMLAARRASVRRGVHILRHYAASRTMPSHGGSLQTGTT